MNDLERAYAALAQDADTVRLTTSDALRGRADRRARIRLATGCAVLAVVVGATAVGAQWVLRSSHGTPPGPSTSQSPSAEPPSPTPATSAPSSPAPTSPSHTKPAPTTIPDSAFLQLADTNGEEPRPSRRRPRRTAAPRRAEAAAAAPGGRHRDPAGRAGRCPAPAVGRPRPGCVRARPRAPPTTSDGWGSPPDRGVQH